MSPSQVQPRDTPRAGVLRVGVLELRPDEGLVLADERPLALSLHELALLTALAEQQGRVVRRPELYERVWQRKFRPGDRAVDVYVRRLRVKLAAVLPQWRFIHTHVGFGYRFAPEHSPRVHMRTTGG